MGETPQWISGELKEDAMAKGGFTLEVIHLAE